jgi:hypothetical protein
MENCLMLIVPIEAGCFDVDEKLAFDVRINGILTKRSHS